MVETLRIPREDRVVRLVEHDPESFAVPPQKAEKFTLVEIVMFPGRSLETKRKLYQAIVKNLGSLGVPSGNVQIVLHEPAVENWGIRGGIPASEVDLGFKVDV